MSYEEYQSGVFVLPLVLFPHEPLTLRVFEPRYHQLIRDCDRSGAPFVVADGADSKVVIPVLEAAASYGTQVQIVSSGLLPSGDRIVELRGTDRVSVRSWLKDDPYPRALVVAAQDMDLPDPVRVAELEGFIKYGIRLAIEMGAKVSIFDPQSLPLEPAARLWGLCARAPLTTEQRKRLFYEPFASTRLEVLGETIAEQVSFYEKMLGIR